MAEPFLSEIKLVSFNFPPKGWALCNGQFLPINQNQALFALLGTTYGGNGQTTFALPNLRGSTPIHMGNGFTLGQKAGTTAVTISIAQLPTHNHLMTVLNVNGNAGPVGNFFASANNAYEPAPGDTSLAPNTVTNVGGSQAHQNMQPFLTLNFCIALQGIFPSQT